MDPNATLTQIIADINDGEYAEANELADALCDWFDNGGFRPSDDNKKAYLAAIAALEDTYPDLLHEEFALDALHGVFFFDLNR